MIEFKNLPSEDTPVNADNLNLLQQIIEKDANGTRYYFPITTKISSSTNFTIPCYYKVGANVLDIYLNGEKLIKANTSDEEGHYYEIGDADSISNQIKSTSDWNLESGDVLELIVRGEWT